MQVQGYQKQVELLWEQLKKAGSALARDMADAVSRKEWLFLRDHHDVAALVELIDGSAREAGFVANFTQPVIWGEPRYGRLGGLGRRKGWLQPPSRSREPWPLPSQSRERNVPAPTPRKTYSYITTVSSASSTESSH